MPTLRQKIWDYCISLKLTILLASLATLLTMGGSLLIHFLPGIFGNLDQVPLGAWFLGRGREHPFFAAWLAALVLLMGLLALNTGCCFLDWLIRLRSRWRKSGEYLLHLGFLLIVCAYLWGGMTGSRQSGLRFSPGAPVPLPGQAGLYLRLDQFDPVFRDGRPIDMISKVTLLQGDSPLSSAAIRINHPLIWKDLVILPESFGQQPTGFRFLLGNGAEVELRPGSRHDLGGDRALLVRGFLPDASIGSDGRAYARSENLGDPALLLQLVTADRLLWQGWYPLRQGLPRAAAVAGLQMTPLAPIFQTYAVLTVNSDPGAHLALAGAAAMLTGVSLALVSFYRKRRRGDRPDIG
ncbi:hypothetical protein JCM30471_12730 [Desulfuromonas carbonis]|uniref:cytochrome c biogenesis protein ResB n=1 Tax=Desulfuromonas sp. DDH964 TaxID=1823759 RepID=UPI00078D008C|nr:cytochrome c biogenesis protein ResB [Desulfuromonas sp. DDH964]AMV72757.1 hypothetical protein DBW_2420 [Desulfuromonas sp. DDH964]